MRLSHAQTKALAEASGVPFTTLWKVRTGETRNPGVETVRLFWPRLPIGELVGADGDPPAPDRSAPGSRRSVDVASASGEVT